MSGHSKWSTIKHQKQANDAVRAKLFSKLAKSIALASKTGGGSNPDTNYKLKIAIEQAKLANMPKANIERVLSKIGKVSDLFEITYEGFGPGGVLMVVEVVTDNKNRVAQEIRGIFEKYGGRFAGPGSVMHSFELKGLVVVKKESDFDEQTLKFIDFGVEDVVELGNGLLELYVDPPALSKFISKVKSTQSEITFSGLVQKPTVFVEIEDNVTKQNLETLVDKLNAHEDVQIVFTNLKN